MCRLFNYLVNFFFIFLVFLHVEELRFYFQFFSFNCSLDFFLSVMINNQTECGIIDKKIAMRAGDNERMIN